MFEVYEYVIVPRVGFTPRNGADVRLKGKPKLLQAFDDIEAARDFSQNHDRKTFIRFSPEAVRAIQQEQQR